jgi:hypothetical protein
MWKSRNKNDLIIEVWEKLDCESVGASEIEAIEIVVKERFGDPAVDSPMALARMLADEGAHLRHSEIMNLWVERQSDRPYDAAFRNILDLSDLKAVRRSIQNLENLRRKLTADGDRDGLRRLRQQVIEAKDEASKTAGNRKKTLEARRLNKEIAQWLTLWLQSPELFENWLKLRRSAADFKAVFGDLD